MKLLLENWRFYLGEASADPKMAKYLKKHPYMEPNGMQEGKNTKKKIIRIRKAKK